MSAMAPSDRSELYAAVITPRVDGALNLEAFGNLVDRMARAGLHGLLIGGSTGRGDLLTAIELSQMLAATTARAPTLERIAGFGAHQLSLDEVLRRIERHRGEAEAFLVPTPDDDQAVVSYFQELVCAASAPILVYHPPARRARPLPGQIIEELVQVDGLLGAKDSSGLDPLLPHWQSAPPSFRLYVGSIRLFARRAPEVRGAILAFLNLCPELGSKLAAMEPGALADWELELRQVEQGGLSQLEVLVAAAGLLD